MARTAEMFPKIWTPRRVLMHVMDAGHGDSMGAIVRWKCGACGLETDWTEVGNTSVSTLKRGVPCPKCNGSNSI